jgi:hypothetical protein
MRTAQNAHDREKEDSVNRRASILSSLGMASVLLLAPTAQAIVYGDLDVVYAENYDDDLALTGLVPQVDLFGAGRLFQVNVGNGPFSPASLALPGPVPRGAARITVTNTHPLGPPYEGTALTFDTSGPSPLPATGNLGVRGVFDDLSVTTDALYRLNAAVFVTQVEGKYIAATFNVIQTSPTPTPLLVLAEGPNGGSATAFSFVLVPGPAYAAIVAGASFQVTLVVDRAAGTATGELVVGATTVSVGPHTLSYVTPSDPLTFPGQALVVQNFDPIVFTAGLDTVSVDFDSLEVRGTAPPVPAPLDADGDATVDGADNCPASLNRDQRDADLDGLGDVCDNCAAEPNSSQADTEGDGAGDACDADDGSPAESLTLLDSSVRPGESVFATATFHNPSANSIVTIAPSCCNTFFRIDHLGVPLAPNHVICDPPVIPRDYIVLDVGESFTVTCDLSEHYAPETLAALAPTTYNVTAFQSNYVTDPDCYPPDPAAPAYVPVPADCIEIVTGAEAFLGTVQSASSTLTVSGDPILSSETARGQCTVSPGTWYAQWAVSTGPAITFTVSGVPAALVDTGSIRLNGISGIVPSSASVSGGNLSFQVERNAAVQSLGSLSPGSAELPVVTGAVSPGSGFEQFRAVCPVAIGAAVPVEIDIKPDTAENTITLGSNGAIPVAILSSPSFAATSVAPGSVTLASATVKLKGKGVPMYSFTDVNDDGLVDLLVHINTTGLVLTEASESADLAGETTGGVPIFGTDAVRVVP